MATIPLIITDESVTAVIQGKSWTIKKGDPNFPSVKKAIADEKWDDIPALVSREVALDKWAEGLFHIKDHWVYRKDDKLPKGLSDRIIRHLESREAATPLLKFWERLDQNPSWRSVQQLYQFLAHESIPIEPDGTFLAYKAVKRNWTDVFTGKIENKPNSVHEMPRNKISDDPKEACHFGFHVGALKYAESFGPTDRRMLICRVDPKDVVCVPYDENQRKMRVCRYTVVGVMGAALPNTTYDVMEDTQLTELPEEFVEDVQVVTEDPNRAARFMSLMERKLSDLREYANKTLGITSVKKIKGGKPALVERILEVEAEKDIKGDTAAPAKVAPAKKEEGPRTETPEPHDIPEDDDPWGEYHVMGVGELSKVPLGTLRKYARHGLSIIGASKIKGGKAALINKIVDTRE